MVYQFAFQILLETVILDEEFMLHFFYSFLSITASGLLYEQGKSWFEKQH